MQKNDLCYNVSVIINRYWHQERIETIYVIVNTNERIAERYVFHSLKSSEFESKVKTYDEKT